MNNLVTQYPYQVTEQERSNLNRLVDYTSVQSLPEIWSLAAQRFGETVALKDPHTKPEVVITYSQLNKLIQQFAAGLQSLGIKAGDRISLFADNSPRWFIADQGIMTAGAVDAVRSGQAEQEELRFIMANSGSTALVVEDLKTLNKLRDYLNDLPIKLIVLLSDEEPEELANIKMLNFSGLVEVGSSVQLEPVKQTKDTLATLIYTSGTTGQPKGVMLSHGNLLHQVTTLGTVIKPQQGSKVLSILPSWHSYERSAEYFLLSQGCTQLYTNLRYIKQDLKTFKPNYMIAVPRLWESIYEGAQKQFREQPSNKQKLINTFFSISQRYIKARRLAQGLDLENLNPSATEKISAKVQASVLAPVHALGERLVYGKVREATGGEIIQVISGGGSLAKHLENFFEIIGVNILVGYGLTETSPVTNARRPWHNLRGSSGKPIPGTEIKIVNPETRQPLPTGERGLVLIKGPQVMQGYYQNPEATAKAIDSEGWFDSGDLGWVTKENDLVLTGRAKDTIVLTNGENIEPQPIEDACLRSAYVDQIVLVGQDQKSLGALIVPNLDALQQWAFSQNLQLRLPADVPNLPKLEASQSQLKEIDLDSKQIQDLFRQELNREVQNRPGYRSDDRIAVFKLILEPFSIENGMMTQTLKIRRPVVMERYHDMINGMF
ncbi:Long-chain-fatty-acid--CoA ligase [Crinalium epipsammum PCC 9333]|uniref:Long-chain-fatty-acid--CoA ligase n=1 Tax=Crinalium epipsammum PCC 9333 TaxID=1173022 RepID=K9W6H0_9CYAN|nr:long-chain fatty acid--CoA ligase [Crinalium epipsammum]AFZ15035.1 Long-chain-fatty-acid--CoA ligase [Crinalium epipsammum PCC 9333]